MNVMVAISGLALVCVAGVTAAAPPTAEDVLTRYEQSLSRLNKFSMSADVATYYLRADQKQERLDSSRNYRVLRDGDRWNILISQRTFPFGGPAEGYSNEFNYVCDGQVLEVYYPHQKVGVRPLVPGAVNGSPTAPEKEQLRAVNFLAHASLALGHFSGIDTRNSLPQVLRSKALSQGALRCGQDERGAFVESMSSKGDSLRLWIDLDAGGVFNGLRALKTTEAENANRFKAERVMIESVYGFAPTAAIKSIEYEVRGVETAVCEGQHVVTQFESLRTFEAVDGTKAHARVVGKYSDWNLSPDVSSRTAFVPVLPVPDNSRVYSPEEESIRYTYRDSRVILDINQPTVKALEQVRLPARRSQGGVQWTWAAISGVLGFIWWRIRAADAS
jgi:hypothetical protein